MTTPTIISNQAIIQPQSTNITSDHDTHKISSPRQIKPTIKIITFKSTNLGNQHVLGHVFSHGQKAALGVVPSIGVKFLVIWIERLYFINSKNKNIATSKNSGMITMIIARALLNYYSAVEQII